MKKILLLSALIITAAFGQRAGAQVHFNINIGLQPAWGPAGYDYAEYYYLPDIESYYCVPRHQFVFFDDGRWVFSDRLPDRCGNYDLYGGYKVVINERDPWCHFDQHRHMYAPFRYRHDQEFIGGGYGNYRQPAYGGGWGRERREYEDHDRGRGWGWGRERHEREEHGWGRGEGNWGHGDRDGHGDHGEHEGGRGHGRRD
jgi:hypothetical protein